MMHAFVTIAAMTAIFAAHVAMIVELRPRGTPQDKKTEAEPGETL
ncbi:MAG TPA: hypothetical protein VF410_03725 [Rhizomicrobium sp.]|jgi:hypothetical protein